MESPLASPSALHSPALGCNASRGHPRHELVFTHADNKHTLVLAVGRLFKLSKQARADQSNPGKLRAPGSRSKVGKTGSGF
jgi:hypothetical protein